LKVLLDTNILIDFLVGVEPARELLDRHRDAAVSLVTCMELLVGARDELDAALLRASCAASRCCPSTGRSQRWRWR